MKTVFLSTLLEFILKRVLDSAYKQSPLGYKPHRLKAHPKPLTKLYKPSVHKQRLRYTNYSQRYSSRWLATMSMSAMMSCESPLLNHS